MDQSNIDYEQAKNQYPLRDNRYTPREELSSSPDPKMGISANDISAFGDESVNDPRPSNYENSPLLLMAGGNRIPG